MLPLRASEDLVVATLPSPGRILIASYHFPPDAAVGGLRLAKAARMFREFGWEPYVLTVRDEYRDQGLDKSRLRGLESVPVTRTGVLPNVMGFLGKTKNLLVGRGPRTNEPGLFTVQAAVQEESSHETMRQRLKRYVVSLVALLPDEKKDWSLKAAFKAVGLIRANHIDYILTSGPPFSTHFIGWLATRLTRAKWIADFRDPWIEMLPERYSHTRSKLSDRIERWMEAAVIRSAYRVVTTTERMCASFSDRYPSVPRGKFVCIPNSIDSASFSRNAVEKYEPLTITYAGTLYFDRTPEPLFKAVQALMVAGRAREGDIQIKLLGNCRSIDGVDTSSLAKHYGLENVVEIIDQVPYADAVRIMEKSHLLLVLAPERHRLVVPAKIFDYLGSGSKILALAEPGATADLMDETGCGEWFLQSDIKGIQDYLGSLLVDGRFRTLRNEPGMFSAYDVKAVMGRLAAELSGPDAHFHSREMIRT